VLVGEGEVGKTSLVAALRDEAFVAGRLTTHGIERHALALPHPSLPDTGLTLNAWDFGGQEVYRITHQFFFSERALYLVVWAPRQGQEQNEVAGWLRRIRLRVAEVRILVVATHCDERNPELDLPALRAQAGAALVGAHEVDNSSGRGVAELRARLAELAAGLPGMGEPISVRWTSVARALRASEQTQISRDEYDAVCAREGLDAVEGAALARLLHQQGHIIHYADDDGLRDIVVLQPEWLTKAIGYVLEDRPTRDVGGVLDHHRLDEIWSREGAAYPRRLYPYFLRLMEKFDVSYRLRDDDGDLDRSLVAQLVSFERPPLPWEPGDPAPAGLRRLALVCELGDEAPGLIAWLTVRNHRYSTGVYWRHGVLLEDNRDASQALFVLAKPKELRLTVRGASPTHFFERLRDSLETMAAKRWPGLTYQFHVPCPGRSVRGAGPCPGQFRLAALELRREAGRATVECQECLRDYDVLELLTGFPSPVVPLQPQLERLQQSINTVDRKVDAVGGDLRQVRVHTAQIAVELRTVLKITEAEVSDCPRLFTFTPVPRAGIRRLRVWEEAYRLTLWCEEPSGMHSRDEASYDLDQVPKWLGTVAPYATLVISALRLILPVAGVAGDLLLSDKAAKNLSRQIDQMRGVIDSAPAAAVDEYLTGIGFQVRDLGTTPSGLTPAQGAGLRRLRSVLFALDAGREFGGLRRVVDPSGDLLWVCPDHYPLYDPGLPDLPGPPAA
jgi:hypothetical protein